MNGGRPVSSIARSVMRSLGADIDGKGGWKFTGKKFAKKRSKTKKSK